MEPLYPQTMGEGVVSNNNYYSVAYTSTKTKSVIVKTKLKKRYRQFEIPLGSSLINLNSAIKEQFDLVDTVGANLSTAYLLWLFFGFFGIHRWYLKMNTGGSFLLWFLTGQFFGLGWLYDGITLYQKVKDFNSYSLSCDEKQLNWFNKYNYSGRPNRAAAYLLWFFFGWIGIHRWYTGYHTPSSFVAWLITGQMFGMGWLYDFYYINTMVNYPRPFLNTSPFFIKCLNKYDYVPVENDTEVENAINTAFSDPDRTLRLIVVEKKREDLAYLLWFLFGCIGGHAWYLQMGNLLIRFFTANYFFFGFVVEGIRLQELISRADLQTGGDFIPSWHGQYQWPLKNNFRILESFETV